MSEPLSCVKCGGPRTVSICAYCGTRYSTFRAVPTKAQDSTLGIIGNYLSDPNDYAQSYSRAYEQYAAQHGLQRRASTLMGAQAIMAQVACRIFG